MFGLTMNADASYVLIVLSLPYVLVLFYVSAAAYCDLRTCRIPNTLNYCTALFSLGLILLYRHQGWLWLSQLPRLDLIAGGLVCGGLTFLLWQMRVLGGGDVKMCFTLGLMLGVQAGLSTLLLAQVFAGGLILGRVVFRLLPRVRYRCLQDGTLVTSLTSQASSIRHDCIPMAGFFALAAVVTLGWRVMQ